MPWLSSLLCGATCGYCVGRVPRHAHGPKRPGGMIAAADERWRPIDRVAASNLTYASFVEMYKRPGVPVIVEGWLNAHPQLER